MGCLGGEGGGGGIEEEKDDVEDNIVVGVGVDEKFAWEELRGRDGDVCWDSDSWQEGGMPL